MPNKLYPSTNSKAKNIICLFSILINLSAIGQLGFRTVTESSVTSYKGDIMFEVGTIINGKFSYSDFRSPTIFEFLKTEGMPISNDTLFSLVTRGSEDFRRIFDSMKIHYSSIDRRNDYLLMLTKEKFESNLIKIKSCMKEKGKRIYLVFIKLKVNIQYNNSCIVAGPYNELYQVRKRKICFPQSPVYLYFKPILNFEILPN